VPTVHDASLAPVGHHVVSILVSWTPIDLAGGWDERRNRELLELLLARLAPHAPTLRGRLVASQVLSPADLEHERALSGGQLHHAEPALDQLFVLRPTAGSARYRTAVPGLWLGGSGSHPGGGVNPTPGLLAAEALLAAPRAR
jgi:phytoene dehydrogenase-like protein